MTVKTLTYAALAERLKRRLEAARSLVIGEVATLKERIESLQAELAKLEATAARHRADYERERDRADRLVTELLKATANTTTELPAKLEAEIAALRFAADHGGDGCALSDQAVANDRAGTTVARGRLLMPAVLEPDQFAR
jgi:polyhydroxyalkanoate synthesis regulator phasin